MTLTPLDVSTTKTNSLMNVEFVLCNLSRACINELQLFVDRDKNGHSPALALLNISADLLADCLNVQIIGTSNTDLSRVDNALSRKGRLIARYEFKELKVKSATSIAKIRFSKRCKIPHDT